MNPVFKLIVSGLLVLIFCISALITWGSLMGLIACVIWVLACLRGHGDGLMMAAPAAGLAVLTIVSSATAWFSFDFAFNKILFPNSKPAWGTSLEEASLAYEDLSKVRFPQREDMSEIQFPPFLVSCARKMLRMSAWQAGLAVSFFLFVVGWLWNY